MLPLAQMKLVSILVLFASLIIGSSVSASVAVAIIVNPPEGTPAEAGSVRQVAHIGVGLLPGLVGERPARPLRGLARPHPLVYSLG
jgi:hypothetical protein